MDAFLKNRGKTLKIINVQYRLAFHFRFLEPGNT